MMIPLDIIAKNDPDKHKSRLLRLNTHRTPKEPQETQSLGAPSNNHGEHFRISRSFWSQKQMLCLEKGISRLSIEISPLHGTLGDIFLFLLSILFWHFRCESVFLPFVMPFCESIVHRQSSKVQYSRTTALSEDLPSYKIKSFKSQALS